MRRLISSSVFCLAVSYFSKLSKKARFSKEKNCWIQNVCIDFLYNFSLKNFSFSQEFSKILSWKDRGLHVKYSFRLPLNLNFLKTFSRNTQISNFVMIRSVRVPLFYVDRRTDGRRDTLETANSHSSHFANVFKGKLGKICYWFTIYHFISSHYFCGLGSQCVFWRPLLLPFSRLVWWVTFTII